MKNIRPEVVTKGKVLVEMAHYGGELTGHRRVIDEVCRKMDVANNEQYQMLNEILDFIDKEYNDASVKEQNAKFKLDEILEQEKSASVQSANSTDNA